MMHRPHRRTQILLTICLLATVLAAGCAGVAGRMIIPIAPETIEPIDAAPLRVLWAKRLVGETDQDLWRPMQYSFPVVEGDIVYLGNTWNAFYAFDAINGDILWKFDTAGPVECGAVVIGDKVVFGDGDGRVYCLNRHTGLLQWTYNVQGQVQGRLATDGALVFIRTSHERLYAVTLADGKWKWMQSREMPDGFTIRGVSSPVVDNGRVLTGFADGYFMAFRAEDGAEVYKTLLQKSDRLVDVDSTPLVVDERIYLAGYGGNFYCLNRDNAAIQWTFNRGSVQRAEIDGDIVYLSDDQGFLFALDKKTGKELWSFDLREYDLERSVAKGPRRKLKIPTTAVPFGKLVLVASSDGYIYGLDREKGKLRWKFWPGYGVTSAMSVAQDRLYVHTNFGNVYCMKPNPFYR